MSARTERPTPRRVREARRRGDVAVSRELTGAAALLAGACVLALRAPAVARELAAYVRLTLASTAADPDAPRALWRAAAVLCGAALPPCAAAALAAVAVGALQTEGLLALGAVTPRLARVDPWKGLARLASPERAGALVLAAAKCAAVLAVAWALLRREAGLLPALPRLAPAELLARSAAALLRLGAALGGLLAAAGAVDLAVARRRRDRRLRMTREEVARERRDEEGDPRHRAERRRLHRVLAAAPPLSRATCLVVNPTHVAVALEHAAGSDDAPVIVAKGEGDAAARLRAAARRAGVPIVRDVALARALFRLAEIGDAIPEELYQAAAAVLVHVHAGREPT